MNGLKTKHTFYKRGNKINNTQTREKVNLIHTNHNEEYIRCEKVNKNKHKNNAKVRLFLFFVMSLGVIKVLVPMQKIFSQRGLNTNNDLANPWMLLICI